MCVWDRCISSEGGDPMPKIIIVDLKRTPLLHEIFGSGVSKLLDYASPLAVAANHR